MSDHTEYLRRATVALRLELPESVADDYCPRVEALLDERDALKVEVTELVVKYGTLGVMFDRLQAERDALAARVATLETAAREVLAWEPEPGDAEWLDLTTLDRWGKDIAALRGALGDDDDG